jgi:hypothetical protein
MTEEATTKLAAPFNGPVEIGLRSLAILNEAFPDAYSLQRLVVFDYVIVHSDDLPGGPPGLHPKTPHRSGELLVRRGVLQTGLMLYQSRGLVERRFDQSGVFFAATEYSAAFLDALGTDYALSLRQRARWLVTKYGVLSDSQIQDLVRENVGEWGTEFEMESVLWEEKTA